MVLLRSLDLFTGIGAFTFAFQDICEPVAYCEIDPMCHKILENNMSRGYLPRAPILKDIKEVANSKYELPPFNAIFAGVPCQDCSTASRGPRLGICGARTGLYWQVVHIIDNNPAVECVFLENVPAISCNGMHLIIASLAQRGFSLCWGNFAASDVGAPHTRRRWYCLATRGPAILDTLKNNFKPGTCNLKPRLTSWELLREPVPRVVTKRSVAPLRSQEDR